jgi:hypothetical protein
MHTGTWGRLILSVFVVSWMSVLLQPCLMAMESADATAPTMESGYINHAKHHGDAATPGTDADCDHCPPAACEAAMSCGAEMSSACELDVRCSLDNRRSKLVLKDVRFDLQPGIASTVIAAPLAEHYFASPRIRIAALKPGYQPPLNLLNCVYLI